MSWGRRYQPRSFTHGVLWFFATLGLYVPYWYYVCHRDMRDHTGRGVGGPWATALFFLVSPVMMFVHSHEVGRMYVARGEDPPVTARTAWWILLPIAGSVWWFFRSNAALNAYWISSGDSLRDP